jgi:hypothetical protein
MLERGDQLRTSTLALGEVLVKPTERGESTLREVWTRNFFGSEFDCLRCKSG